MIDYTGFVQISYNPGTLEWIAPPVVCDDYPCTATWTIDGYADDETGAIVGEEEA